MNLVERIKKYEQILDRVNLVMDQSADDPLMIESIREDVKSLEEYYCSPEWKEDYDADVAGVLPADLKRGVLSQDGIDHTLDRFRDLSEKRQHPWEEISLSDYENHMSLPSVQQLQALNQAMKDQLDQPDVTSVMILGIAGGNGLEHLDGKKYRPAFAVDINADYLAEVKRRYPDLEGTLECICLDLSADAETLPHADLLIANLVVEYIGYEAFQRVAVSVDPDHISCVIQVNEDEGFVSESPYLHAFDRLEEIHCQIEEDALTESMEGIGYHLAWKKTYPLPNGKTLLRMDFVR